MVLSLPFFSIDKLQIISKARTMISQDGDYYICEGETATESVSQSPGKEPEQQVFEAKGDIKEQLSLIKTRIQTLKELKMEQSSQAKASSWLQQYNDPDVTAEDFSLQLYIPEQVLAMERRVDKLEGKVTGYQVYRQRTEKKGTVVQRVKNLQKKLSDILRAKSIETITNSIIQYSTNLDEKEEHMKQLYIYDVYTKTQGLTDELTTLEDYLHQLSAVQSQISSAVPTATLVENHNQIVEKAHAARSRVETLFKHMKEEYQQLLKEIDAIEI